MRAVTLTKAYVICIVFLVLTITSYVFIPSLFSVGYEYSDEKGVVQGERIISKASIAEETESRAEHISTPAAVKALYMTSWVASTKSLRNKIIKLLDTSEANTLIIDVKDYTGKIAFKVQDAELASMGADEKRISDIDELIAELHAKNIYIIARIAVFQDPYLVSIRPELAVKRKSDGGIWKDRKGITWIDAGAKESWDYNLAIAKEAYRRGFDEVNFDYIRFPSDGNMTDIMFPWSKDRAKAEVMREFFAYVESKMQPEGIPTSADIFGMTTTASDDMRIGQILEYALAHFDYVAPMVYPSHYPTGWEGMKNPAEKPYEVIYSAMKSAVDRAKTTTSRFKFPDSTLVASTSPQLYTKKPESIAKLRPWLQDFDLGATYTPEMIRAQIKAAYDVGLTSWMIWDPSNKYISTSQALEKN